MIGKYKFYKSKDESRLMSIGNDNYRPGLTPPQPLKKSSGWLSSNMAQLMVFLNGLILTVTAYATLSVFIQQIVKEDFVNTTAEVQDYIENSYNGYETTLSTMTTFVELMPDTENSGILEYTKNELPDLKDFEEIYWVKHSPEGSVVTPILNNKSFGIEWRQAFVKNRLPMAEEEEFFIVDSKFLPKDDLKLYSSIFVTVNKMNAKPNNYLVGLIDKKNIVPIEWLAKKKSIAALEVMSVSKDTAGFSYQSEDRDKSSSDLDYYVSLTQLAFADDTFDIKLSLRFNKREAFLQKIPLLMLLFGVTLTMIGTLYVRNNQSQSQKLSSMNKELAYKNYELNQQMSERDRLNKVIQKSAEENKAIINAVSDIIFEISTDGTILFLNEVWEKVTGYQTERSISRNLFDLLHEKDREEQIALFNSVVSGEKSSYRSYTSIHCADNKFRTIEIAISMLRQDENKDLRAVGTIMDVEERRRAEKALGEAEKKYRAIVDNAANGIYQVTPEGLFLSANPAFANIVGYNDPEEILNNITNAQEQLYVDSALRIRLLKEVANLKKPQNFEIQIKQKNGERLWVAENIRPVFDDDGALIFFEGSIEDIHKRKEAEIALTDAKIESDLANRAKSEFLTNMSHELRTPLNSVIGFAEIIKNETYGVLAQKEYKEYAENIFGSGRKLLNVINEILDVSHIEAGNRELKEGVVSIQDSITSSLEMMNGKINDKKIRVENKVMDSTFSIIGEKHAVKQMLLNLMSNAIRFSADNSYIMIDAELDHDQNLRVSITDTGIGLTDAELEKALSPFGQINNDHSRDTSGTGLGLTLVKSLIELHGGELEMVSQKNIGTTATLIFPEKRVAKSLNTDNKQAS